MDFITHLYHEKNEYYHRIILRLVQSTYSILSAKFQLKNSKDTNECQKPTFCLVHKGKVSLPFYDIRRDDACISLINTNIIKGKTNREYIQYFSEISFQQTLRQLILAGE